MNDTQIKSLIAEIRGEQHISPFEEDKVLEGYIKEAEYDINKNAGAEINYEVDLKAKSLLKNYVMYCRFGRLAEFRQLYGAEYAYLQAIYYKPSNIQWWKI